MSATYNLNISTKPETINGEEHYFWYIEGRNELGQAYNNGFGWAINIPAAFDAAYKYLKENAQKLPIDLPEKEHFGLHDYDIVTKIPKDYYIWNIGDNMGSDSYIPFCKDDPEHPDSYSIDLRSLLAVKLPDPDVITLRKAANHGLCSIKACDEIINKPYNNPNMSDEYNKETNRLAPIAKEILSKIYDDTI